MVSLVRALRKLFAKKESPPRVKPAPQQLPRETAKVRFRIGRKVATVQGGR